jgi:hypothetical protein
MRGRIYPFAAAFAFAAPVASLAQTAANSVAPSPPVVSTPAPLSIAPAPVSQPVLPAGAPLTVMLNDTLSSQANQVGDRFQVVVVDDVSDRGAIVIPRGTIGYGEVTFSTSKGGWGKGGILGITLRYLELNGKTVELDGRYREEGKQRDGAAGATMFAAGIFAALVKGSASTIPKGRLLKAHTAADISYVAPDAVSSPASVTATATDDPTAASAPASADQPAAASGRVPAGPN